MRQLINSIFVTGLFISSFCLAGEDTSGAAITVAPEDNSCCSQRLGSKFHEHFDTTSKVVLPMLMLIPVGFDVVSSYFSDASRKDAHTLTKDSEKAWLASEILGAIGAATSFVSASTLVYGFAAEAPLRCVLGIGEGMAAIATFANFANSIVSSVAFGTEDPRSFENKMALGFAWPAFVLQALVYANFRVYS